jgi:hypothetical protein
MHDVISKKITGPNEKFSAEKQYEIQKQAQDFLTGKVDDIEGLGSIRMVQEFLLQMRTGFVKLKQEQATLLEANPQHKSEQA